VNISQPKVRSEKFDDDDDNNNNNNNYNNNNTRLVEEYDAGKTKYSVKKTG